jgi:hypothetical protein
VNVKHTRGPWVSSISSMADDLRSSFEIRPLGTLRSLIATVSRWKVSGPEAVAEGEANARLIVSAPDYALVLWALTSGYATWEPWAGLPKGELCFGGLRYVTDVDELGCPVLHEVTRPRLEAARAAR